MPLKKWIAALTALCVLLAVAQAQSIFDATPAPTSEPVGLPLSEYIYADGSNSTLGVRFSYPSHWEYIPGHHTVCFKEPVNDGDIAARMAISVKQLSDRADEDRMTSELASFLYAISSQFDMSPEVGNLITDVSFMGKTGYSTIYRATLNGKTVRGYVIMACVGTKIYAYHFSAAEEDYNAMSQVMETLRTSIQAANS